MTQTSDPDAFCAGQNSDLQQAVSRKLSDLNEYLSICRLILRNMIHSMTETALNESISHNFIVQMIPQQLAAVEMSRNLLTYSHDDPLRAVASGIISEQTKSIADMEKILPACGLLLNPPAHLCLYQIRMNQIMEEMFAQMTFPEYQSDINTAFMSEMIPHHEGAVRMSETALRYHICPELEPILKEIIISRQRGIRQMRRSLENLSNT